MQSQPETENEETETDEGVLQPDPEGDELLPDCAMEDEDVALLNIPYSTRAAGDWVSAGTLDPLYAERALENGWRRRRYFPTWDDAERWARNFFGDRFKGRVMDAVNSQAPIWAFLIAGPRGESVSN